MPTLYVRNIDPETVQALRKAARLRGWTVAEYIAALVQLHRGVNVEPRSDAITNALVASLGLAPVVES